MTDSAIIELVELFKSRDIAKRMAAVTRAAELVSPESIALLIKALQDPSWTLRERAVSALCHAGPAALVPLARLLTGGVWFARTAAAMVLERIGTAAMLPPLLRQCADGNRSVAQAAARAVSAIAERCGEEEALRQLLPLQGAARRQAIDALAPLRPETARQLSLVPADAVSEDAAAYLVRQEQAGERLQDLRKAIKAALKQDSKDEDETP